MNMTFRTAAGLLLLASGAPLAQIQNPPLTFEIASIRRSELPNTGASIGVRPGGTFIAQNLPVRSLIGSAFELPPDRVLGGPGWTNDEPYVIDARAEGLTSMTQARPLLLALLRDRFRLEARRETRELPVYLLQLARPDRALGPRIRENNLDCRNPDARAKATATAAPGRRICGITFGVGRLSASVISINDLVPILTSVSGRTVLNRTGLDGLYDIDLEWAPTPDVSDAVSIFTAVQEQLGLKLETGTAPTDVVVIERVERPSEN